MSSSEAEYIALTEAALEAIPLRQLLTDLGFPPNGPAIICKDDTSAIAFAKEHFTSRRAKHINVCHHWIRQKITDHSVDVQYINNEKQVAEISCVRISKVQPLFSIVTLF